MQNKNGVCLESRILSLGACELELFTSFRAQTVAPVMSVKPTDTLQPGFPYI